MEKKRWGVTLIASSFLGLLIIGIGLIVRYNASENAEQIAHLKPIQPMSVGVLSDTPVGAEVLIEGWVSTRSEHYKYGLVIYKYQEYESGDDGGWETRKTVKYPLVLNVGGEEVSVENTNYRFEGLRVVWQRDREERYLGIVIDDPVLVLGTLKRNDDGVAVTANIVARGDKDSYLADQRRKVGAGRVGGMVAYLLGAMVIAFGLWRTAYQIALNSVPVPEIQVSPTLAAMGQRIRVAWAFTEKTDKLTQFTLELHGRETAADTSGSGTSYHKKEFANIELAHVNADQGDVASGQREIDLPAMTLPSFHSRHNDVTWTLETRTRMRWRPVAKRSHPEVIKILPPAPDSPPSQAELRHKAKRPVPSDAPIRTHDGRTHYLPGEEISGTVTWQMKNPEDSVTLRLCCRTQGKGDEDLLVIDEQSLPAHSGTNTHDVHVQIPEAVGTPSSFRGNLIALEWALELVIMPTEGKRGPLGIKYKPKEQVQRLPLVVSPTGDTLRL